MQLGGAYLVYSLGKTMYDIHCLVRESENLLKRNAAKHGLDVSFDLDEWKTMSRILTFKAEPDGDIDVLREYIDAEKRGAHLVAAMKGIELADRLDGYGTVKINTHK